MNVCKIGWSTKEFFFVCNRKEDIKSGGEKKNKRGKNTSALPTVRANGLTATWKMFPR